MVPYFPPGDEALARAVEAVAKSRHAVLLANHGPVVAGKDIDQAVYAMEELEEAARLYFLLRQERTRILGSEEINVLESRYPS